MDPDSHHGVQDRDQEEERALLIIQRLSYHVARPSLTPGPWRHSVQGNRLTNAAHPLRAPTGWDWFRNRKAAGSANILRSGGDNVLLYAAVLSEALLSELDFEDSPELELDLLISEELAFDDSEEPLEAVSLEPLEVPSLGIESFADSLLLFERA